MKISTSRLRVPSAFLCVSLVLFCLAGCRNGGSHQDDAVVRLIDAAPAVQELAVDVDGQRVWKHAVFRSNTGFQGISAGTYKIDIDAETVAGRMTGHNYLSCEKGKAYTVVAFGESSDPHELPSLRIFNEDRKEPIPTNKVMLRFINAGDQTGSVDVLFDNIVGFGGIPVGARSAPILLDPGAYAVKVNQADQLLGLTGSVDLHFLPGHAYTLVTMGRRDAGLQNSGLSLEVYPDDQ